ncbi:MAG TPA: paraslipin, partial [Balneola sp.]|nr:paraslipin [Balneola sp.]
MEIVELVSKILVGLITLFVIFKVIKSLRLVPNQYSFIVERLGNYHKTLGPGFHALVPFIDKVVYKQDLREETIEVEPQECFTKDNVKVEVDGVIYLSVTDPVNASYGVTNYR